MKKIHDLKSPVTKRVIPWIPAVSTDIRNHSFARAREELAQQSAPQSKVREIRKGAK